MKRILTFGVYDMLHIGHVILFNRAKSLGDYLIVAVQDGVQIQKYKPNAQMVYSTEERLFMVSSIRYVDEVVTYKDVDVDIQKIDFDVFVKGPDQNHQGLKKAEEWCLKNEKMVITLPRTEGISSSLLRNKNQ